jgi:large subunit ribosomal protein L6
MSRIGKKPVQIPQGVEVKVQGRRLTVKGPKGQLSWEHPERVAVSVEAATAQVTRSDDQKQSRAYHGLTRSLLQNMVTGVSEGYRKEMSIVGVGYRAQAQGNKLVLSLGYSHPVEYELPEGISVEVDKKQVQFTLSGIDKHKLGQVAANIRSLRPPDAYKGKGVRYADEVVRLKAGKTAK